MVGLLIVVVMLLTAGMAPVLAPHNPTLVRLDQMLLPPRWVEGGSPEHVLGTDQIGRDVLSRLIYGSRVSVVVGISAVLIAGSIGVSLGLISGYWGGFLDTIIMRLVDAFQSVPAVVFALLLIAVFGSNVYVLIVALGLRAWYVYARTVRAETLVIIEKDYIQAARSLGQSDFGILFRHVLPNAISSVIVLSTVSMATIIIAEAGLSFLGLGVAPPTPTWGNMLADGREYILSAWWLAIFPGVALMIAVLGIMFLGDWLRDYLDPRVREN